MCCFGSIGSKLLLVIGLLSVRTLYSQTVQEDFYPISDQTINCSFKTLEYHKVGADGVWMTNSDSSQFIIIELYTDMHRIRTLHVDSHFEYLLNSELYFYYKSSKTSWDNLETSKNYLFLNRFLEKCEQISDTCFISEQGCMIGDSSSLGLLAYGNPDSTYLMDSITVRLWEFNSLEFPEMGDIGNGKYVRDGFGYDVKHYYYDDKLVMRVLYRHIP